MEPAELDTLIEDVRADLWTLFETADPPPDEAFERVIDEALRDARDAHADMTEVDARYLKPLVFAHARGYVRGRLRRASSP